MSYVYVFPESYGIHFLSLLLKCGDNYVQLRKFAIYSILYIMYFGQFKLRMEVNCNQNESFIQGNNIVKNLKNAIV